MKYLIALVLTTVAWPVFAHTALVSTVPAARATVAAPLKEIALEFGGDVRLTALVLADSQGKEKAMAPIPTEIAKSFALAIRDELAAGQYVVTWRAVGADTHIVSGDFRFTVTAMPSH